MIVLDELREELHAEPVTLPGRAAQMVRAVTYDLEAESRRFADGAVIGRPDPELHGGLLKAEQRRQMEKAIVQAMRRTVEEAMQALGYDEEETAAALATIEVAAWEADGTDVHVSFAGPERVVQYLDAISGGDFLLADLIRSGGVLLGRGMVR